MGKVLLIGGSSHSGKSTLATELGLRTGSRVIATDSLARHPGRPWREHPNSIPEHVRAHYATLTVDELIEDVLKHYKKLWPRVAQLILAQLSNADSERLIIEGAALWPDWVSTLVQEGITKVWLTTTDEVFQQRIYQSANYFKKSLPEQVLIDKFLARTLQFNTLMMQQVFKHNLPSIQVQEFPSPSSLADRLLTNEIDKR
ncbi:MAG: hypothetical protein ACFB15_23670 [Cyclobacteriaceae bacterium]